MLFTEVVQQSCDAAGVCTDRPDTWVTSKQFYAGLGVVQALPGPLFNFSAYLGAIMAMNTGYVFIVGTLLAWFGLFMPGIMVGRAVGGGWAQGLVGGGWQRRHLLAWFGLFLPGIWGGWGGAVHC